MRVTQAIILHTIQDVKHCLKYGLHKDATLFSANVHVVYYLKFQYGLECCNLCSYVEPKTFLEIEMNALQTSGLLLRELDQQVAPLLNEELNLTMRYFEPLYSLTGARQLSLYMILKDCLTQMLEQYSFDLILIYDGELGPLNIKMADFLVRIFPDNQFQMISYERTNKVASKTVIKNIDISDLAEIIRQCDSGDLRGAVLTHQGAKDNNLLIFKPVKKLSFLTQETNEANVYCFDANAAAMRDRCEYEISFHIFPDEYLDNICLAHQDCKDILFLLYETICNDFCKNIVQYLQVIHQYKTFHEQSTMRRVYWETPFVQGVGALLLEYFIANQGTQVIGMQEWSTFFAGQLLGAYFAVTVFNRCHCFVTQGATKPDMEELYPGALTETSIISPETIFRDNSNPMVFPVSRTSVDVAIYIRPTVSLLQSGYISASVGIQERLLAFLEEKGDKEIHIITHSHSTLENCAMLSLLRTQKNITWINNTELDKYLMSYDPKLIFMDSPLPLISDIVRTDITIILLKDPLNVFRGRSLEALAKRVYFAEDYEEVEYLLQLYFDGGLEKKRDSAYLFKFCNQAGLKEKLLGCLDV